MNALPKFYQRQRGVALLIILLVVAIISGLAAKMSGRTQLFIARTMNQNDYDQAYWMAIGVETMGKRLLLNDLNESDTVNLGQLWAQTRENGYPMPVENASILVKARDLHSCFNVNALSGKKAKQTNNKTDQTGKTKAKKIYKNLLINLGVDDGKASQLTDALSDYVDSDSNVQEFGAEDNEYLSKNVPYLAANTLMNDISELRVVHGYDRSLYAQLQRYVCVIPNRSDLKLNINTVESPALMQALLDNDVSQTEAKQWITERPQDGWDKIDEFKTLIGKSTLENKDFIQITSQFFSIEVTAGVDMSEGVPRVQLTLQSVIEKKGKESMVVLTRQVKEA